MCSTLGFQKYKFVIFLKTHKNLAFVMTFNPYPLFYKKLLKYEGQLGWG